MKIYPAIDIKDGKCVRLFKGQFETAQVFNDSPLDQAIIFEQEGFTNLHIVDLDGALHGKPVNSGHIQKIIKNTNLSVQVGGGLRNLESCAKLFDIGVDRVIVGTGAVEDEDFLIALSSGFDQKVVLGLDALNGFVSINGWKDVSNLSVEHILEKYKSLDIGGVIYTDISKDGTMTGPNLESLAKFAAISAFPIIASGGISSIDDLFSVSKIPNVSAAILGKSLYLNSITSQALRSGNFI